MQYIACAFNKQVLAIWGGTSPLLDVEPYYGERRLPGDWAGADTGGFPALALMKILWCPASVASPAQALAAKDAPQGILSA